jgi:hypothetical protein
MLLLQVTLSFQTLDFSSSSSSYVVYIPEYKEGSSVGIRDVDGGGGKTREDDEDDDSSSSTHITEPPSPSSWSKKTDEE